MLILDTSDLLLLVFMGECVIRVKSIQAASVCTIHLHFPTFKFTHLRNRSLASWRGGQESKLTLFTGQLSNFDSSILFCPPSDFPASAFNRFLFMAAECSRRPELLFMVTTAPRSWQLQLMFYNLLFVSVTLHVHLNRVE